MFNYEIVRAENKHIVALAATIRPSDRREVWAMHRFTPYEALVTSLDFSQLAWTGLLEGRPVLMWGVGRLGGPDSKIGAPWLLSSGEAEKLMPLICLRYYQRFVQIMQKRYELLENFVHGANDIGIKWLRWGGFTVEVAPEIINGEIFHYFWRK